MPAISRCGSGFTPTTAPYPVVPKGSPPAPNVVAEVPAQVYYSLAFPQPKDEIWFYQSQVVSNGFQLPNAWTGAMAQGIDAVANTLLHEFRHTEQVSLANTLVDMTKAPWINGWSWNESPHNHWTLGLDGKPGCPGLDDDHDGAVDNLTTLPSSPSFIGELGRGVGTVCGTDDKRLSSEDSLLTSYFDSNWPKSTLFGAPPTKAGEGMTGPCDDSPIEVDACKREPQDLQQFSKIDWACPGKNHRIGWNGSPSGC